MSVTDTIGTDWTGGNADLIDLALSTRPRINELVVWRSFDNGVVVWGSAGAPVVLPPHQARRIPGQVSRAHQATRTAPPQKGRSAQHPKTFPSRSKIARTSKDCPATRVVRLQSGKVSERGPVAVGTGPTAARSEKTVRNQLI